MRLKKSQVNFDEFTHSYFCKDKMLIGVTSLMKKHGLGADYSGIPDSVLAAAAERGTAIHKMLEDYDNGKQIEDSPLVRAYKKLNLKVKCSEYLVSDNNIVASMIDKVLDDNSIADVKTTSEVHTDALRWQLSIYKYLFESQNPSLKADKLYCIHIPLKKAIDGTYVHKWCKLIEITPIPIEEIEKLFECEKSGTLYYSNDLSEEKDADLSLALSTYDVFELEKIENHIVEFERQLAMQKELALQYREKVMGYMMANGIKSMRTESLKYTLVAPYQKKTIDGKALREELPEIAERYTKTSEVKASLKFTLLTN